jgi:hypothetical protein
MVKPLPFIFLSFLLAGVVIALLIAAIESSIWVTFEDFMENEYEWGLFTCSKCPDESHAMEWECWQ